MNRVQKTISAVAALGVVAGISIVSGAVKTQAWGDNGGLRTGYTKAQINSGVLGDKVVFNSITDGSIGDERNFVGARVDDGNNKGASNVWNANEITVEDGKTYLVRMYVHNNSPKGYGAIAQNVKATFSLSKNYATENAITGYIDSSNATPTQYWDSVVFKSNNGQRFYLDYVEGSALVENNGYAKNGAALSDSIITKNGVMLGYDAAGDGKIPGCYQYSQFVTIRVKPVFTDGNYTVQKVVRMANGEDKTWHESIEAKVGDVVEYQIYYKNATEGKAENVIVRDVLPTNMTSKTNPTVYNATTGSTGRVSDKDFTKESISIGGYAVKGDAYMRFTATVTDKDLICGTNVLRNFAQIRVGNIVREDSADVVVKKACEPEPEKCADGSEPNEKGECPEPKKCADGSDPDENGECPEPKKCADGSEPNEKGECPEPKKCADGSEPNEKGECPEPKKCDDGSEPDENGECPTPKPVKKCDDGSTPDANGNCPVPAPAPVKEMPQTGASGIIGISAIITALGCFISSRRHLG